MQNVQVCMTANRRQISGSQHLLWESVASTEKPMPKHPGRLADEKQTHPSSEMSAEEQGCLADKARPSLLERRPMLPL